MPHIHEKIDFTSEVYIVNEGAILLRMHEKYDLWCGAGGHIELDEDMVAAALREAKEETGLDVTLLGEIAPDYPDGEQELLVPSYINRHRTNETHEHVSFIYFATSTTRELNPAEGEATEGFKWFTREELDDSTFGVNPRIVGYAKAALTAAGF